MIGFCHRAARRIGRLAAHMTFAALVVATAVQAAAAADMPGRLDPFSPAAPLVMATARAAPPSPVDVPPPESRRLAWIDPPPFAGDVWAGAEPTDVRLFLTMLPTGAPSPAMRGLMRRLLLSPADAIEHLGEPSLLGLRAGMLAELAMADELLAIAAAEPAFAEDEAASAALIDVLLLSDRRSEACGRLDDVVGRFSGPQWDNRSLVCLLIEERYDAASAALEALVADDTDPVFLSMATALAARRSVELPDQAWRSLATPDAQLLTLLDLSDRAVSRAALRVSDPGRLLAIADNVSTPSDVRLDAAERVAANGAIAPWRLAELYAELPFAAEQLESALYMVTRESGPHIRALVEQTARSLEDPAEALQLREYLLRIASSESAPLAVMLALLDPIEPASRASSIAILAARTYYASNDLDRARVWHALARADAVLHDSGGDLATLWPLAWLADESERGDTDFDRGLQTWLAAELDAAGDTGTYGAAVSLAALRALGQPIDPAMWHLLAVDDRRDATSLPSGPIWWRLEEAAEAGQVGLTALLALVALGEDGPGAAHPVLLERVLSSLVEVGLQGEARRLALEAIWAAQL